METSHHHALHNNRELRQMQSNVLARALDSPLLQIFTFAAVDLVAQYALFAKYNYENYFQKFQRNNAQIGASVTNSHFRWLRLQRSGRSGRYGFGKDAHPNGASPQSNCRPIPNAAMRNGRRPSASVTLARMQLNLAREDLTVPSSPK